MKVEQKIRLEMSSPKTLNVTTFSPNSDVFDVLFYDFNLISTNLINITPQLCFSSKWFSRGPGPTMGLQQTLGASR